MTKRLKALEEIDAFLKGTYTSPPGKLPSSEVEKEKDGDSQGNDKASAPKAKDARQPHNMTRDSHAFLLQILEVVNAHVSECIANKRPVEPTPLTILGQDERRHLGTNSAFRRLRERITIAHSAVVVGDAPGGDELDRFLFGVCARPPFLPNTSGYTRQRTSVKVLITVMQAHFAATAVGLVRLNAPYFLLACEWRTELSGQSGPAMVLQLVNNKDDKDALPEGIVISTNAISGTPSIKKEQFLYVGMMIVDIALVTASGGVPDFTF